MIQRNVVFLSVLALSLVADCSCGDGKSLGPSSQQPNANLTCTYDDGASGDPGASWCRIDGYVHTCNGSTGQWRPTGQKCNQ